ncbi:MAG: hypothetical protein RLZZ181_424 [Pseudomonadota bacterium]|jgi:hypothetical protein
MAIMRTGPGKKAKTTSSSRKVTSKDVVSKIRSVFGGEKGTGKSKGGSAASGVVSRVGGVREFAPVSVGPKKKDVIKGYKAKKKSGEMTRKEANAKIKNLRGVTVKPKGKGGGYLSLGGMTRQKISALPAMDSATFVNTIRNAPASPKSGLPFTGSAGQKYGANSKDMAMRQMKAAQKKYGPGTRFKDFKYDPKTGSYVFTAY